MITAIILTYNEEKHLERCLMSVHGLAQNILVIDSFSTDRTSEIAQNHGAKFLQRKFINQADQLNWALENLNIDTEWILRLDADEYLTPELYKEINDRIKTIPHNVNGIVFKLRVYFMGKWIKNGGYYPMKLLRMWRNGKASIDNKMMDERMNVLSGEILEFNHDLVDENLSTLVHWTDKHNNYSTREAIVRLDAKYKFLNETEQLVHKSNKQFYLKLPLFFRALFYFCFRFFLKRGFLDGKQGLIWHFLQGFWYQFLVDAKIFQIEYLAKKENKTVKQIIEEKFNFKF